MNQEQLSEHLFREGVEVADNRKRILAYAIDDILISIIFTIIFWNQFLAASGILEIQNLLNQAFFSIVAVKVLYHTFFVYQYGATIGKIAMKIRVLEYMTMDKPTLLCAFTRAIFRVVSEVIFYFGFVIAFFDKNKQTLHDKVSKCVVINA